MTQTLIRPAKGLAPENSDQDRPGPNFDRALANTVTYYLWALCKGDVSLNINGDSALPAFWRIYHKVWAIVDSQDFATVDARKQPTPKDVEAMAEERRRYIGDVCLVADETVPGLEVSQQFDADGHAVTFDNAKVRDAETAACVWNSLDREYFNEAPGIGKDDLRIIWHAVKHRALKGPREEDRAEARYVSKVAGLDIAGFDQVPWPTASDWRGENLPEPVIHPAPPLMAHLQKDLVQ